MRLYRSAVIEGGSALKKTKRAGFLTKLVIVVLIVVVAISLLNLQGRITTAQAALEELQAQVDEQTQYNAALQDDIDHRDDPDVVLDVAKAKLGLVDKDEVIFYDTTN
jgi:cell division protein FtsL